MSRHAAASRMPCHAQRGWFRPRVRSAWHRATNRRPGSLAVCADSSSHGSLWFNEARAARSHLGFVPGIAATALMGAAMAATAVVVMLSKKKNHLPHPFELDPSIQPLGPVPHDSSCPSGHAAISEAAATVLELFDRQHFAEYESLAQQVAAARVYSGVHLPSDVAVGATVGRHVGGWFT